MALPVPVRVIVTVPPDTGLLFASLTVTVTVDASDHDGSIKKIECYVDGKLVGEVDARPYRVSVTNLPPGPHVITARAIDERGGAGVSDAVRVTVTDE